MAGQKYKEFADLKSLQDQTDAIITMFSSIESGLKRLSEYGIKLNSSKAVSETAKLTTEFEELKRATQAQQNELVKLAAKLKLSTNEEAKKIEGGKQVLALTKQLVAADQKRQLLNQQEYVGLRQQALANKEIAKSIELRIKLNNARAGSEEKLALQYQKAQLILSRQAPAQRESDRGKALQKFAADTKKALDDIQQKVGNFKGNVGNYAQSLAGGFDLVSKEIAKLKQQAQGLQDLAARDPIGFKLGGGDIELKKTTAAFEELERVQTIGFKTNQSYNTTVKDITKSVADMAASGNVSKEFLQEFTQFAAEAQREASNIRNEIKRLSSETHGLDQASGALQTLASGFEAVSGVAALAGSNTEEVEKSIQKLVAIQSVANGIREIGKQVTEKGTIANKAYNFVLQQGTVLFGKGSTAAQRFGAALKGIVILAVIGFLIELIKYLAATGDNAETAQKHVEELNNELERNKKISKSISESDQFDFQSDLEGLKRAGAERLKLAKTEDERRAITLANEKEQFDLEVKFREDNLKKLRVIQENANDDEIREAQRQNEYKRALLQRGRKKISEEEAKALKDAIKLTENANAEAKENLKKAQRDLILFKKQNNTKLAEDDAEQEQKNREKRKSFLDKQKQDELDLFVFRKNLQKEAAESLSSLDSPLSERTKIEKAKEAAQAEIDIITATSEHELKQEGITAFKRIQITEEAANKILDIEINLGNKINQIRIDGLQELKRQAQEGSDAFDADIADRIQKERDVQQKQFDQEQLNNQKNRDKRLEDAAIVADKQLELAGDNNEARLRIEQQYAEKKKQIEFDYQAVTIQSSINQYERLLADQKKYGEDTTQTEQLIQEKKKELAELGFDERQAIAQKDFELAQQVRDNYLSAFSQIQDVFTNVMGGIAEKRKAQIDQEINLIEERKKREIDAANASTDSDEKKAARIKIIESKAQTEREQLERRQRQIDRQRAIAERAFKAFQITTDTIQSVAKIKAQIAILASNPLTVPYVPVATSQLILTIASGAAALSSLLATPLPRFAKGTASAPEGPAIVGEKGAEIGIERGGKVKLFDKPSVTYLQRGTKILPHDVTMDLVNATINEQMKPTFNIKVDNKQTNLDHEILSELKTFNKKQRALYIYNHPSIESTPYYQQQLKH